MGYRMRNIFCNDSEVAAFVTCLSRFMKQHMQEGLMIEDLTLLPTEMEVKRIDLQQTTAVVTIEDEGKSLIGMSIADGILKQMCQAFVSDIDETSSELEELYDATAAELLNLAVGRCLEKMDADNGSVYFTPPKVVHGSRTLHKKEWSFQSGATIRSKQGDVTLFCFFPKD